MEVEMSLKVHNWNARMLKLVLILINVPIWQKVQVIYSSGLNHCILLTLTSILNFLALIKLFKYLTVILKIYQTFDENDA